MVVHHSKSGVLASCALLTLAACSDASAEGAGSGGSGSGAGALPTDPIDLTTAYIYVPEEKLDMSGLTCPFASNEDVNAIYRTILGNAPFVVDKLETDRCVWNNGSAVSMSIERRSLSDKKDPATDKYNLDIEPEIIPLDGPGENAVILTDEVLQGPYSLYFETGGNQINIRLTGLISTKEKLGRLAETVAEKADAVITGPDAEGSASPAGPTLEPCEPYNADQIAQLFGNKEPVTAGGLKDLSTCTYEGSGNPGGIRELHFKYSAEAFNLSRFSPYGEPDKLDRFSVPVYSKATTSYQTTYAIDLGEGHVVLSARFADIEQDEEAVAQLIRNLIERAS